MGQANGADDLKHPMQPIYLDDELKPRFKPNEVVIYLKKRIDIEDLLDLPFKQDDLEQFIQLLGYSVCGFDELSYIRNETKEKAIEEAEKLIKSTPKKRKKK